jgi:hypothetical protein
MITGQSTVTEHRVASSERKCDGSQFKQEVEPMELAYWPKGHFSHGRSWLVALNLPAAQ